MGGESLKYGRGVWLSFETGGSLRPKSDAHINLLMPPFSENGITDTNTVSHLIPLNC